MPGDMNGESTTGAESLMPYPEYYAQLMENVYVKQAMSLYDTAKHSTQFTETSLDKVEQGVNGVARYAAQKAVDNYNHYYVRPKQAVTEVYNSGYEKTAKALEVSKNAAVTSGTVALGAAVVATQFGLALSAGGAGLLLDSVTATKDAGHRVVTTVRSVEEAVEKRIWNTISEAQRIAKIPIDKLAESSASLLDIVTTLTERSLGITIPDSPDATLTQRVSTLAREIVAKLSSTAQGSVIDPVQAQLTSLLEHLSKSFVIVDLVRSKGEWALEKVEELSSSVSDLKSRIETEARQVNKRPEEFLMSSIRKNSEQLRGRLVDLKDKGHRVFGDGTRVEVLIDYLRDLDQQLAESQDIYQVRDEVFTEARQRLAQMTSWTTRLLSRKSTPSTSEASETQENSEQDA